MLAAGSAPRKPNRRRRVVVVVVAAARFAILVAAALVVAGTPMNRADAFRPPPPTVSLPAPSATRTTASSRLFVSPPPTDSGSSDREAATASSAATTPPTTHTRRGILSRALVLLSATTTLVASAAANPSGASAASSSPEDDVREMRAVIEEARKQLDAVPQLLADEKWDGVRSVLMEAPLRDCWSKTTPVLKKYAEALGETPTGDELAALEGKEELLQHLRFLDMAVYNNVFNPIATEGKTGASGALIDSYYNDPKREYDASKKAIEELIALGGGG